MLRKKHVTQLIIIFNSIFVGGMLLGRDNVSNRNVEPPGKFVDSTKDLIAKRNQILDLVNAGTGNFAAKEQISNQILSLTNQMSARLNELELKTWAEKETTLPVRSSIAEISYLGFVIAEEKIPAAYQSELDEMRVYLDILGARLADMNRDVTSLVFSDVKRHAQVLVFEGGERILPKGQRDAVEKFLNSQKAKQRGPAKITIFAWGKTGDNVNLAAARADKVSHFIYSIYDPREVRTINMDKEHNVFQKLFNTEEYQIKEAYRSTQELPDSRERTIGWFLSRSAGPNHLVVLFE